MRSKRGSAPRPAGGMIPPDPSLMGERLVQGLAVTFDAYPHRHEQE